MARPSIEEREPTPDERRNGWTRESLSKYLAERRDQIKAYAEAQAKRPNRTARTETTTTFDPHLWG
jgi:hypothetical protein